MMDNHSVKETLTFSEVKLSSKCVKAVLTIHPTTSWTPNPEKDRVKLTTADGVVLNFLTPTISESHDNIFTITLCIELAIDVEYRLVYLDKNRRERGSSSTFSMTNTTNMSPTILPGSLSPDLQSSGSFEAVSDEESSFAVITGEDSMNGGNFVTGSWQMADSGDRSSDSSSEDELSLVQAQPMDNPAIAMTNHLELITTGNKLQQLELHDDADDPPEYTSKDSPSNQQSKSPYGHDDITLMTSNTTESEGLSNGVHLNTETKVSSVAGSVSVGVPKVLPEVMSKSAIFGDNADVHLSKSEVQSLETRNRAHVKKIKKLSELLDSEKKFSIQLLQTIEKKTEENATLNETARILQCEVKNAQRRLKKAAKDSEEKDQLIISLKASNELLRKQFDEQMKVDVVNQAFPLSKGSSDKPPIVNSRRDETTPIGEDDRKCDIGIVKPSSSEDKKHNRESTNSQRQRHRRSNHRSSHRNERQPPPWYRRSPPKPNDQQHPFLNDFEHIRMPAIKQGDQYVSCPVCNRMMPSTLTEEQMAKHVDSCLRKREA